MKKIFTPIGILTIFIVILLVLYNSMFILDNKYTTPAPRVQDGVLQISESMVEGEQPIFLIDDWQIQQANGQNLTTYIGEFSNYQRSSREISPLGTATYALRINYIGQPKTFSLELPELFSEYHLWWNDQLMTSGSGNAKCQVTPVTGENTLTVTVTAAHGYYAGMYFPGMLGTENSLLKIERLKSLFYGIAFLIPLTIALFSLILWKNSKDRLHGLFGGFCLSYSIYVSYYFVQLLGFSFAAHWYLIEDCAFYALLYFAVSITLTAAGITGQKLKKVATAVAFLLPVIEVILYFLAPHWVLAVFIHGRLQDLYRVLIVILLGIGVIKLIRTSSSLSISHYFSLCGNIVLGAGILTQLLDSNLFEPIRGLWQMEWCGLILVVIFGGMMIEQNRRIIEENQAYTQQMEDLVTKRTKELICVLDERRQFFYEMAHDLKAPVAAMNSFMQMIRKHSIGLDSQLSYYLNQIEKKQYLIYKRVDSISALNALERINDPKEKFAVADFFMMVHHIYAPEAMVKKVHLVVEPCPEIYLYMQREKLVTAFENLIYNALRATPPNGNIRLSALSKNDKAYLFIEDTGCGIPKDEINHIFDRYFVGNNNKSDGSGLGLYIVKSIVEEIGGSISVSSTAGTGTAFTLCLPLGSDK